MSGDDLSFRRETRRPSPGAGGLVFTFLVTVALFAATRIWWTPSAPAGTLVEVTGDVPHPGHFAVSPPTVHAALRAAGVQDPPPSVRGGAVHDGVHLEVSDGKVRVVPPTEPLLVALPIDVNEASAQAIAAIPGVGPSTAEAIVADRVERGPFRVLDDLRRVKGVGARGLGEMRPFVTVSEVPRLDLNQASAAQLETLPGIGPVLAARIVVSRADQGPFDSAHDLVRVSGIGPATVAKLEELVVARPP